MRLRQDVFSEKETRSGLLGLVVAGAAFGGPRVFDIVNGFLIDAVAHRPVGAVRLWVGRMRHDNLAEILTASSWVAGCLCRLVAGGVGSQA